MNVNECHSAWELAAHRAFDLSLVKVLVVDFTDRQNSDVFEMFKRAGRTMILPVITKIRPTDDSRELNGYRDRIVSIAPEATVLEPLLCNDFDIIDTPRDYPERIAERLIERLASGLIGHQLPLLLTEFLEGERIRFKTESRLLAGEHLRASKHAVEQFQKSISQSLKAATADLLGNDKELCAGVRWSLRMELIDRSPAWCFPWRPFLTIASLAAGAVDRLPLALLGSIPSLGTVIYRTVRNVKEAAAFQKSATDGLTRRLAQEMRGALHDQFLLLDDAIRHDLTEESGVTTRECATLEPIGLDKLQDESTKVFHSAVESYAPGRCAATVFAVSGFGIFWVVFGWPLAALYQSIARGARAVFENRLDAASLFPHGTGSILLTSGLLGIIPMFLFLLATMSWLIRRSLVNRCLSSLRSNHEILCSNLIENGGISVRIREPRLDACRSLLSATED